MHFTISKNKEISQMKKMIIAVCQGALKTKKQNYFKLLWIVYTSYTFYCGAIRKTIFLLRREDDNLFLVAMVIW